MPLGNFEVVNGEIEQGKWTIADDKYMQREGLVFNKALPLACISTVARTQEEKTGFLKNTVHFIVTLTNGNSFIAKADEKSYQRLFEAQHITKKNDVVFEKRVNSGLIFASIAALVFYAYLHAGTNKSAPEPVKSADISITAKALAGEYDRNEARADAKFKGKTLQVKGVVDSITKDVADNTVIILKGNNQFLGVHATIREDYEKAAIDLEQGQVITVQCEGKGEVISAPMLDKCSII